MLKIKFTLNKDENLVPYKEPKEFYVFARRYSREGDHVCIETEDYSVLKYRTRSIDNIEVTEYEQTRQS